MTSLNILVVEDDDAMRQLLVEELSDEGYAVDAAETGKVALSKIKSAHYDIVVTDLRMPELDGLDLLRELKDVDNRPDIIMITAFGSIDTAIKAVKLGAYDFITKPFEIEQLLLVVGKASKQRKMERKLVQLQEQVESKNRFDRIVAESEVMQDVVSIAQRVADSTVTVLITGESGTGKELLARALHYNSARRNGAFIAVNLGALPSSLIEAELFGHEKGAFTDAHTARPGLFRDADGGTIFLDEIGELPLELQTKMLRVLQESEVRPLGSSETESIDVRVIAATNRDLDDMRAAGEFRDDLFYRISVVELPIPPLRDRKKDLLPLIEELWQELQAATAKRCELPGHVRETLLTYDWPGNVRELRNVLERMLALSESGAIGDDALPTRISSPSTSSILANASEEGMSLAELEKIYILHVLEQEGGNKTRAAKKLGLDRKTLYRKLGEYKDT